MSTPTNWTAGCPPGTEFILQGIPDAVPNETHCGLAISGGGIKLVQACCQGGRLHNISQDGTEGECFAVCSGGFPPSRNSTEYDKSRQAMILCMATAGIQWNWSIHPEMNGFSCLSGGYNSLINKPSGAMGGHGGGIGRLVLLGVVFDALLAL